MEPLEVIEHVSARLVACPVLAMIHPLALEQPEEALASTVVGAVTNVTDAVYQGIATQERLLGAADERATAIRMQNDLGFSFSLPHHHLHGTHDHERILPRVHRPAAHHQLAVEVDDDAHVQFPFPRRDLGDSLAIDPETLEPVADDVEAYGLVQSVLRGGAYGEILRTLETYGDYHRTNAGEPVRKALAAPTSTKPNHPSSATPR